MKISDELSPKKIVLCLDGNSLSLRKVGPANGDELNELRELDKKGLTQFFVIDTSTSFIAPKGALDKLTDDFSSDNNVFFEIIDRSQQGQNLVEIHASNIWLRKSALTPAQFHERVREEDLLLDNYKKVR